MPEQQTDLNTLIGSVLTGEYKKRRMRQGEIAELIDMPLVTLQRKLNGKSPISTTEFLAICAAMIPPVDAGRIIDEVQQLWAAMSVPAGTNDLQRKRTEKEAEARSMSTDQLDQVTERAATTDPELEQDEPPTP